MPRKKTAQPAQPTEKTMSIEGVPIITELPATPVPVVNPMGIEAERLRKLLIDSDIDPDTGEDRRKPAEETGFFDVTPDEVFGVLEPEELAELSDRISELPCIAELAARVDAIERKLRGE